MAIIPASGRRAPDVTQRPVQYLKITDVHAVREIGLAWSAERRLLLAAELFREHVIDQARTHALPPVA